MPKWTTNATCHQMIGLNEHMSLKINHLVTLVIAYMQLIEAYSQLEYPKGWSNEKRTTKDYFGFLLHLLFHDYTKLLYDYN